jgi:hypothetical protein
VLPTLLIAFASAATDCRPPEDWARCPVARVLHPVAWDYGAQYQRALAAVLAGPHANPVFTEALAEADVHWRLFEATGRGLDLPADRAQAWTDLSLAGSVLAVDVLVGQLVAQSEEAEAVRKVLDLWADPNADFTFGPDGRVRVEHRTGGAAARRMRRAAQDEGFEEEAFDNATGPAVGDAGGDPDADLPAARTGRGRRDPAAAERPRRGRPVKVHLGVGWTLRPIDAPPSPTPLGWGAEISVQNAGLTLWRADVDLLHLTWNAAARERLIGPLSLGAGVHSADRDPAPSRWSCGLYWKPVERAVVSFQRLAAFDDPTWRLQLALELRLGAPIVGGSDRLPLRPNRLVPAIASPANDR